MMIELLSGTMVIKNGRPRKQKQKKNFCHKIVCRINAVELYVVTINEKPWTRARKVCKALKYEKAARRVVRHHCTRENIQHKYQLVVVPRVGFTKTRSVHQ